MQNDADTSQINRTGPAERWNPRTPWADASEAARIKATHRRAALMPFLAVKETDSRSQADFEGAGVAAYQKIFGHPISGRGFAELYRRTIERDGSRNEWTRLEIYLDDHVMPPRPAPSPFSHAPLAESVKSIVAQPGAKLQKRQKQFIWLSAWQHLNQIAPRGSEFHAAAKRSIRQYLLSAFPMLAASPDAMKRIFDLKCAALEKTEGKPSAIEDRREVASGFHRGPELGEDTARIIMAYTVRHCGGRLAQAWRDYINGRIPGIAPDRRLLDYFIANPASKSFVPRTVSECVKYRIAAMKSLHHGTYQYEQTAHLPLDESAIFAGDYWSSDDTTLPVYFFLKDSTGKILLKRGQFLVTADRRSRRILGFVLIPEEAYDSIAIRNHFTATADDHGLPRRGLEWERGLWERSKLLKGDANADTVPPEEAELGLLELRIEFTHRRSAKGKIVERVIGALQNRMEGEPGYCGRNEQTERFEEFHRLKADVEAGRVDPNGKIYSFQQWTERLLQICADYNAEPFGRDTALAGMSPNQAYETFQNPADPPVKFDASTRYLLSTHRRAVKVKPNGIEFAIGNRKFIYRNDRTGSLVNQKVLVWFCPESPDIACVTDLKRRNPFAVERAMPLPPLGADPERLAEEMQKLRSHQAPIRALYRSLKAEFKQAFRRNLISPESVETGQAFDQARQEIIDRRATRKNLGRKAGRAGLLLAQPVRDLDDASEAIDRLKEIRARRRARAVESQAEEESR